MNTSPATLPGPVVTGADLGPEHQGCYVTVTTVVTEENEANGLGSLGETVTVIGIVYRAERAIQPVTDRRVTRLILRMPGHDALMAFNLGGGNPARVIAED